MGARLGISVRVAIIIALIIGLVIGIVATYLAVPPKIQTITTTETKTKTETSVLTETKTIKETVTSPVTTILTETKIMTETETTTVEKEVPLTLAELAEKIRKGEIDVGNVYSMKPGARYHNIHANVLGLDCTTCHVANKYPDDYLYQRKYKLPIRGAPGVVDRAVCLGCHTKGGIAHELYWPTSKS